MRKTLILLALAMPACTNAINFKPTMASDPPQLGFEGIALANELAKAYERPLRPNGLCVDIQLGYQDARKSSVVRYKSEKRDAGDIFRCVQFNPKATTADVESHVRAGLALSDYFCDNFFERIAEHSGKRRFARNVTNDVGALVSTVLGLAAAGSGVTGGIGAGFGLLDGTWRNYDDNFLVSADLPTLQKLVYSEQDKFRTALRMPGNYPDATNIILRYANLCSFVGMRSLLTSSMAQKTDENNAETGAPAENIVRARAAEFVKAYDAAQKAKATAGQAQPADGADQPPPAPPSPPTG